MFVYIKSLYSEINESLDFHHVLIDLKFSCQGKIYINGIYEQSNILWMEAK